MPSSLDILRRIDWSMVENDVVDRIRLLAAVARSLTDDREEANVNQERIARDLIIPAINVLLQFRDCVRVTIPSETFEEN